MYFYAKFWVHHLSLLIVDILQIFYMLIYSRMYNFASEFTIITIFVNSIYVLFVVHFI